jgi:hypothetical protein
MVRSLRLLLEVLYKYRFIALDLTLLSRNYPDFRADAIARAKRRQTLCLEIAYFLQREGYLRPELNEGHYRRMIHNLLMLINAWIIDAEVFYDGEEGRKIEYYLELIYTLVRPSLTPQGLKAFGSLIAS